MFYMNLNYSSSISSSVSLAEGLNPRLVALSLVKEAIDILWSSLRVWTTVRVYDGAGKVFGVYMPTTTVLLFLAVCVCVCLCVCAWMCVYTVCKEVSV